MANDSTPYDVSIGRLQMSGPHQTSGGRWCLWVDISETPLPAELDRAPRWRATTAEVDTQEATPEDWLLVVALPSDGLPLFARPGAKPADSLVLGRLAGIWSVPA